MHFNVYLLVGIAIMWGKVQSYPCNCGLGLGANVCKSADCQPLVVRPQELPLIDLGSFSKPKIICKKVGGDVAPLKPLGGLCSCGLSIIKPAVVPRPACACCSSSSSSSSSNSNSEYSEASSSAQIGQGGQILTAGGGINVQFPACGVPIFQQRRPDVPQVPADIVSQDIAYRKQQRQKNDKAELKLFYGFAKTPAEYACVAKKTKFQERNYQLVNGQVVELPNFAPESEESQESYEEVEDERPESIEILTPSFGDLGYRLAGYKDSKFVNVQVQESQPTVCGGLGDLDGLGNLDCHDGYRPGQVIIKEGPINSEIPPPSPFLPSCPEEDDLPCEGPIYYKSAASSSSSCNNQQSQVLFEKIYS